MRVQQWTDTSSTANVLLGMIAPYSASAQRTAIQFNPSGIKITQPDGATSVCAGEAPLEVGDWFQLQIVRANNLIAVRVNGSLVASVDAGALGGSFAFGAYRADADFGGVGIQRLDAAPADFPTEATGCSWDGFVGEAQPVLANQLGYNLGEPMRFTAPKAEDGAAFQIVDGSGVSLFEGELSDGVGDFSGLAPNSVGPFIARVQGSAGEGQSSPFGIGADWIERVTYDRAIQFMTDVRCFYGQLEGKPLNGTHTNCNRGLGWRDSHQMSFEVPALIDLYFANPSAIGAIEVPEAVYTGLQYPTTEGAPEVARLISWGTEIYLRGAYNHTLIKEQLAAFLHAYPEFSEWIDPDLYSAVRDYLFPIWSGADKSRYAWADFTDHTADLLQVYQQVGTGKGEFPVGHSIVPNLQMHEVALREGRDDADVYLDAALSQIEWIVGHVNVADPTVTKGQRQAEYHLMTALATAVHMLPEDKRPDGIHVFAERWAETAIQRSDNMWDFRRYDDERWTLPPIQSHSGTLADPNETGNLLGFPAAALATVVLLGDGVSSDRLTEIASAHVDNIFGRNPTGRSATYRATSAAFGFEGADVGWYSEYQGGGGRLQGARGVFDGSPKNGHYPFNPGIGNVGHTEGWVTFNVAWLEALAWRAYDNTSIRVGVDSAAPDESVPVLLEAPLNMDVAGGNSGEVEVSVNGVERQSLVVTQDAPNTRQYSASLDLAELGVEVGDTVEVSYGLDQFERQASFEIADAETVPVTVAAESRCLASKVYLTVTASNEGDQPVSVLITTAYGTKSFATLRSGNNAFHAFTTRLTSLAAGQARATVSRLVNGQTVSTELVATYPARSC